MNIQPATPTHEITEIDLTDLSQWHSLNEIEELYPNIKKSSIYWKLRKKKTNGLDNVIKKFGKNYLVHVGAFSVWLSKE